VAQQAREAGCVQVPLRTRDGEREAGAGKGACRVAGEVGETRNAPRLVELRRLDRESILRQCESGWLEAGDFALSRRVL
jgi:hypothetical protein